MKFAKIKNSEKKYEIGKLVCVGRNYAEHAQELGNEIPEFPLVFIKPSSAVIFDGEEIVIPKFSNEVHHEAELLLLIGKKIKNATIEESEDAVIAFGVGLDMTARDVQDQLKKKGHPWTISKCFDTSAVLSEFVSKENYNLIGNEVITLKVNGEIKQNSSIDKMIFNWKEIVKFISHEMTLEEGDIIFTGTPKGVGKVLKDDVIETEITNIGKITNKVTKES
ncbi:MAG: fumarylacetoacetate hydrolase family protein [Melioribacteraceae bacterium]|jgi:5-carboxymethyl-2-hydroxymuconate isomerase|nr:fumarylacetoacetate hydrolase family protein [Melioribacteraceae bacterium]